MAHVTKVITKLQRRRVVHVSGYRKSRRTGQEFPVYSLRAARANRLDYHPLISGMTSERLVEYPFVARNLVQRGKKAKLLEIGSGGSELSSEIAKFGRKKWTVFSVDLAKQGCNTRMDAELLGFQTGVFDQVISISTIEHIGLGRIPGDREGDLKAMAEILRVLKKGGSAIVTVPYDRTASAGVRHRVYDRRSLAELVGGFVVARKEFYTYAGGKWLRCTQRVADLGQSKDVPKKLHSAVCVCVLLKKTG